MTSHFNNIGRKQRMRVLAYKCVKNAAFNVWEAAWEKIKSFHEKHPIITCILVVIALFDLILFCYEIFIAVEWVFRLGIKIWLLCITALAVIIAFFKLIGKHPTIPLILSIIALVILIIPLIIVIFELPLSYKICQLLDTNSRNEAIKFIALGMGGVVAAIIAASVNCRVAAQEHGNELVRKGNDNIRFQEIVEDLGHDRTTVRVTAFYRFFYLAEKKQDTDEKTEKLRKDVFEILCGCLRSISSGTFNADKNEQEYRVERQALFDVLFKGKFRGNMEDERNWIPSGFSADLYKVHLAELNLSGADLSGANLAEADLSGTNLSGANLSGANLAEANLLGANLSGANLSRMNLLDADLSGVNLLGANLSGTALSDVNLSGADLSGMKFSGVDISGEDLSDVDFSDVKFSGVDISNVNLSNTKLSGADLSGMNLSNMNLSGADLSGAKISNSDLSNTDLSCANLSGAGLSNTNLSGADLSGTNLSGAVLSNVDFSDVDFPGTDLSNTNLSKADLSNTDLSNTNMSKANLSNTDLLDANLSGADISGADMTDANLAQAKLTKAQLQDINFEDVSSI